MYEEGTGVDADFVAAAKWYRLAAEAGDAIGQHALGMLYRNILPLRLSKIMRRQ